MYIFMDFSFKNRKMRLNKLEASKLKELVINSVRQKEDQFKKHLNEVQINNITQELINNCKSDVNNKVYESTINLLISQFETICKPVILNELRNELTPSVTNTLMDELKA